MSTKAVRPSASLSCAKASEVLNQPYNRTIPTPALRAPAAAATSSPKLSDISNNSAGYWDATLVHLRQDFNALAVDRAAAVEELDYVSLYLACCGTTIATERLVSLLRQSIRGTRQNYSLDTDISPFLLWVISVLVSQSSHDHPRGILTADDAQRLNGSAALLTPHRSPGITQRRTGWPAPSSTGGGWLGGAPLANGGSAVVRGSIDATTTTEDAVSQAATSNGSPASTWGPARILQLHVAARLKASHVPGTWSPTSIDSTRRLPPLKGGDPSSTEFHHRRPGTPQSEATSLDYPDLRQILNTSPFHIRPHVNYVLIPSVNGYLMNIYKHSLLPPWERFAYVRDFYPLVEKCMVDGATSDGRLFAATVILAMPWLNTSDTRDDVTTTTDQQASMDRSSSLAVHDALAGVFDSSHDLPSLGTSGPVSSHENRSTIVSAAGPPPPGSGVSRKSLVPHVDFVVPQRLLHQRLVAGRVVLEFAELVCEAQRDALKLEDHSLQEREAAASSLQLRLPLREAAITEFLTRFQQYAMTVQMVQTTSGIGRSFISETRAREEALRVARGGLLVQANAIDVELRRLGTETERIFELRDRTLTSEAQFREARNVTDGLLKQLISLNGELRKTQEALKESTRAAQRLRDRWIEVEQQIADVPQRRKQLAGQLTSREKQEVKAVSDLQQLEANLSELQVCAKQQAVDRETLAAGHRAASTTLRLLIGWARRVDIDPLERSGMATQGGPRRRRTASSSDYDGSTTDTAGLLSSSASSPLEVRPGSNSGTSRASLRDVALADHAVALHRILQSLPTSLDASCPELRAFRQDMTEKPEEVPSAETWVAALHGILQQTLAGLERRHAAPDATEVDTKIRTLSDQRVAVENELKRRRTEVEQLKQALTVHGDTKGLIERSAQLQANVRISDEDVQKITGAAEQLEVQVKAIESEIEKKKAAARCLEGEFLTLRENLLQAVQESNDTRRRLGIDMQKLETKLSTFIADLSSAQEDRMYAPLNRLLLQFALEEETKVREDFRNQIVQLTELLRASGDVLAHMSTERLPGCGPSTPESEETSGAA